MAPVSIIIRPCRRSVNAEIKPARRGAGSGNGVRLRPKDKRSAKEAGRLSVRKTRFAPLGVKHRSAALQHKKTWFLYPPPGLPPTVGTYYNIFISVYTLRQNGA